MFRISFFISLIGLGVASSVEHPSMDGTSLLGMIRNDPKALMKILNKDMYNKDAVDKIVQLLRDLVDEGEAEIKDIDDGIAAALENVNKSKARWDDAISKEKIAENTLDDAKKALARAEGVYEQAQKTFDTESPALDKEISVFTSVLEIMEGLLNGEAPSKEARTFISLADQADPVKVKRVIELVKKLLAASRAERKVLVDDLAEAKRKVEHFEGLVDAAEGRLLLARADTRDSMAAYLRAVGGYNTLKRNGETRKVVINEEASLLASAIKILNSLRNKRNN